MANVEDFFFKHKTAYEMRISDWSSDVCSSDLAAKLAARKTWKHSSAPLKSGASVPTMAPSFSSRLTAASQISTTSASTGDRPRSGVQAMRQQIGGAPCRESVCQYV